MAASIRTIEGIGPQAIDIFERAGFFNVGQLKAFDGDDRRLWQAVEARKAAATTTFPNSYWRRLMTRCINIIYRARSAEATGYVPHEYMCPISLDWYHNPVVTASGHSYSRAELEEHMETSTLDPLTRVDLEGCPIFDNIALRHAVEHYRLHYSLHRILS